MIVQSQDPAIHRQQRLAEDVRNGRRTYDLTLAEAWLNQANVDWERYTKADDYGY